MKRTVFLTGASRGIGKAIFKLLQKEKYKIIAPMRQELDLSKPISIKHLIEINKKAEIDILINNAGINFPQWIDELEDEKTKVGEDRQHFLNLWNRRKRKANHVFGYQACH